MGAELSASEGQPRVALLFGSEKTGLSDAELSHCHWLLTIPMAVTEVASVTAGSPSISRTTDWLFEHLRTANRPVDAER